MRISAPLLRGLPSRSLLQRGQLNRNRSAVLQEPHDIRRQLKDGMERMTTTNDSAVPTRVTHHRGRPLRERHDGDYWVIIGLHAYFEMGEQEHAVWDLVDGRNSLSDISQSMCEKYSVERAVVDPEVRAFCEHLARENLIEWKAAD